MITTRGKLRPTYKQVLETIRAMSPADQRRLRAELTKTSAVYVLRPTGSQAAVRRGRRLVAQIRKQVSASTTGTLEETMQRLRGRSWS
ncbi:MAG: hypothetical protein IT331_05810 [Anaerolineae bacterium]|nr:hypothetical protein [Anaerolineae bacterium]